jgi:hypothetical protein
MIKKMHHRIKMPITLQYILPEELDLPSGDVKATAQRVYMVQQHLELLRTLKKEDLKSQVAKPFRDAYTDFKLSVSLPELVRNFLMPHKCNFCLLVCCSSCGSWPAVSNNRGLPRLLPQAAQPSK